MKRSLKNIIMILMIVAVGVCSYFTMKNTQENQVTQNEPNSNMQMPNEGANNNNGNMEEPPAKPDDNNSNSGNQMSEPPSKPEGDNTNNENQMNEPPEMPSSMPTEKTNNNEIETIYYVLFGIEGCIMSL